MPEPTLPPPITVITPTKRYSNLWEELWEFRDLFFFLSRRNLFLKYKQTVFGLAWVLVPPFFMMAVFTLVFGRLAQLPSFNIPYPLLVFTGFIPWTFFCNMLMESIDSLLMDSQIISRIYFPRLIIPASRIVGGLQDLGIALLVFYVIAPLFHLACLPNIPAIFVLTFFLMLMTMGLGCFFSTLNVRYRDFRHIVGYGLQLLLYLSPIGYSRGILPESWRPIYDLNPMVGFIEGFRWAMLGGRYPLALSSLLYSMAFAVVVFILGLRYFRNRESTFSDYI